jgi:hypothetical protein
MERLCVLKWRMGVVMGGVLVEVLRLCRIIRNGAFDLVQYVHGAEN